MAKGTKKETARSSGGERQFHLTTYYKIVTIYTLITAIAYGALYIARAKGYQLINASILYWLSFALMIGIILLIGKYVANLPKSESTRRGVRIAVAILSIAIIFMSYVRIVSQIDSGLMKYATLTSPDGAHTVILMRANTRFPATETADAKVYTTYAAYPKLNRYFCETNGYTDFVMLLDDEDAPVNMEWADDSLTLTVNSDASLTEDNVIEVTFQ